MRFIFVTCFLAYTVHTAFAAPPVVNYFFPAGASRGTTVSVTASGAIPEKGVTVWTNGDGIEWKTTDKKGEFQVDVAEDAAPGVYYVRLANAEGASIPRPFVVGMLPEAVESDITQPLKKPTVVNGKLAAGGEVDVLPFELKQHQTFVAQLAAHRPLGSPVDAVMQICDERGFVLAQNDDAGGLDPLLEFRAPHDGVYQVRLFGFPETPNSTIAFAGADNYVYRLTLSNAAWIDYTLPLASDGNTTVTPRGWNLPSALALQASRRGAGDTVFFSPDAGGSATIPAAVGAVLIGDGTIPQSIEFPVDISGCLSQAHESHSFTFDAKKNDRVDFRAQSRALGFPTDTVLAIQDESGQSIMENDDANQLRDSQLTFKAPADGTYELQVRDLHKRGGKRFAYRITGTQPTPDFRLTVEKGEYEFGKGKSLELPVAIERLNGFTEEIEVTAANLPAGVTVNKATSQSNGDTAKKVTLKLDANDNASGPFRISGTTKSGNDITATFTVTPQNERLTDIWITVK